MGSVDAQHQTKRPDNHRHPRSGYQDDPHNTPLSCIDTEKSYADRDDMQGQIVFQRIAGTGSTAAMEKRAAELLRRAIPLRRIWLTSAPPSCLRRRPRHPDQEPPRAQRFELRLASLRVRSPYAEWVQSRVLDIDTTRRRLVDLTDEVRTFCAGRGDGLCNVFVPHATAGVAIIETGAGSDDDLLDALERLLPRDDRYRHAHGSPGHGADHVLPAIVSPSVTVPVQGGRPLLGTWQSIVLVDLNADNPRRSVRLSFVSG